MERDPRLRRLSEEHHHGLAFALRIERELPAADDAAVEELYADLLRFWTRGAAAALPRRVRVPARATAAPHGAR